MGRHYQLWKKQLDDASDEYEVAVEAEKNEAGIFSIDDLSYQPVSAEINGALTLASRRKGNSINVVNAPDDRDLLESGDSLSSTTTTDGVPQSESTAKKMNRKEHLESQEKEKEKLIYKMLRSEGESM